jgi:hypothetical protein
MGGMGTYYRVVNRTRGEAFDGADVWPGLGGIKERPTMLLCGPALVWALMRGEWSPTDEIAVIGDGSDDYDVRGFSVPSWLAEYQREWPVREDEEPNPELCPHNFPWKHVGKCEDCFPNPKP